MARRGTAVEGRSLSLRLTPDLQEVLRRHAFERRRSLNSLITDILRLWAIAATDPTDPFFNPRAMGVRMPDAPEEVYPGYRESLIFAIDKE